MKVKCLTNKAGVAFKGTKLPFGTSVDSIYGVDINVVYTVVGMHFWRSELSYFIYNGSYPVICPIQLFEVVDTKISKNWHFRQYSTNENQHTEAAWGYYEFCFDDSHYEKIIDNDQNALSLFFLKLKEMEDENE
jgi:hypothetical protein